MAAPYVPVIGGVMSPVTPGVVGVLPGEFGDIGEMGRDAGQLVVERRQERETAEFAGDQSDGSIFARDENPTAAAIAAESFAGATADRNSSAERHSVTIVKDKLPMDLIICD